MTTTGSVSGCYLLYLHFNPIEKEFRREGLIVGFTWFAINILLDSVILIPMMKTSFMDYFQSIGLGYTSIPAIAITMGYLLDKKVKK